MSEVRATVTGVLAGATRDLECSSIGVRPSLNGQISDFNSVLVEMGIGVLSKL